MSVMENRMKSRRGINSPQLAGMPGAMGTEGQLRARQFADGPPIAGDMGELGVCPVDHRCREPDLGPEQLSERPENRIGGRTLASHPPREIELRSEAMEHAGNGWL